MTIQVLKPEKEEFDDIVFKKIGFTTLSLVKKYCFKN